MHTINEGGQFLFTVADNFARLQKLIYGDGCVMTAASENPLFLEAVA